jgi:hypothetical protein
MSIDIKNLRHFPRSSASVRGKKLSRNLGIAAWCNAATHSFSLPKALAGTFVLCPGLCFPKCLSRETRNREAHVALLLEINSALWIMIACFAIKTSDLIQYLTF